MTDPFEIEAEHIERLNPEQFTRLLRKLLHLEADAHDIPRSAVHVSLQISVPDGGEDGRIKWEDGPASTDYIPDRFTLFQIKAQPISPAKCGAEVVNEAGTDLKQQVREVLDQGGCYVLFCHKGYNQRQIRQRIYKAREAFRSALQDGKDARIEFYDGNKIAQWVNGFFAAQLYVLECNGISVGPGIKTWDEWRSHENYQVEYVSNERLKGHIDTIRKLFAAEASPRLRVTGLSGLGKTRLVLEACRPTKAGESGESGLLSAKVAYTDESLEGGAALAFLSQMRKLGRRGVLIVDNCEDSLHRELVHELGYKGGDGISLITLDFEPEQARNPVWRSLQLCQEDCKGVVSGILEQLFPGLPKSTVSRIEDFAEGFASIAVLLGARVREGAEDIGEISDDELVKRLLGGRRDADAETISAAKACALFEYVQFSDDKITGDVEFLASHVARVDGNAFFKVCRYCLRRGIMQRRGRYIKVCPLPLATTLASKWFEEVPTEDIFDLIRNLRNGDLYSRFCDRLKRLSFSRKARDVVKKLFEKQGPLEDPEYLLTEEGSEVLGALVEVNPPATMDALEAALQDKTPAEFAEIRDRSRRNLVWGLEKLCWWKDTFARAAELLLALAAAENESWGNNATGEFLGLFHIYLSGTEADLTARALIVREALASEVRGERELAVKALGSALVSDSFSRAGGPESQGSRTPRRDYEPTGKEIFAYWKECIQLLVGLIGEGGEFSDLAASELGQRMRGLLQHGMIAEIEAAVEAVAKARGGYWPEALVTVRHCLDYDAEEMPADIRTRIESLEKKLQPADVGKRLQLVVSIPDWRMKEGDGGEYVSVAAEEAESLADELSRDTVWYGKLELIFRGEQRQGYAFGRRLGEKTSDRQKFIEASLDCLRRIPAKEGNPDVLGGFLRGLPDRGLVSQTMDEIIRDGKLVVYAVKITRDLEITREDLARIVPLVKEKRVPVSDFQVFSYGRALDHLPEDFVAEFCKEVAAHSTEGTWCALHVLYMYCHAKESRFSACRPAFRDLVMTDDLLQCEHQVSLAAHDWEVVCEKLLSQDEEDTELAAYLSAQIIKMCSFGGALRCASTQSVEVVLGILLKRYFDISWPVVGEALMDKGSVALLELQHLMKPREDEKQTQGLIADLPEEKIIEWCKQNEPRGPAALANLVPIFGDKEGMSWHPLAKRIIDEFGQLAEVQQGLSANMGTFAWVGSGAPHHDRRIRLLSQLAGHDSPEVRRWAKAEAEYYTTLRDQALCEAQEFQWGII